MNPIDAALASLKPGESVNYAQVARKYGCDRSTLSKRHRGVQGTRAKKIENSRFLNKIQEKKLVEHINRLCELGLPPSRQMIRNVASEIGGRQAGKLWVDRFIERFDITLLSPWTSGTNTSRESADSESNNSLHSKLLRRQIEQYNVDPQHIYNMAEKGFLIGAPSGKKRIFTKREYKEDGFEQTLQDGNLEWITIRACICADGSFLSPMLIYQALTANIIQDPWFQGFDPAIHKAYFASSPSGWTNNYLGLKWLERVFDHETRAKARRSYRLLILDGYGLHITRQFIDYCDKNRILLALYPPFSTHTLQPIDFCLFEPLSRAYSTALAKHMGKRLGLSSTIKGDFFPLFNQSWETSLKAKTILSAFEKSGLHLSEPQRVLARFGQLEQEQSPSSDSAGSVSSQKEQDRSPSSKSAGSVLIAGDWRKIGRLMREVITDANNENSPQSSQLSQTFYHFSLLMDENRQLKDENRRLKEVLINERKELPREKPLLLEPRPQYDDGIAFRSPSKVQKTRQRRDPKVADTEALQHQKMGEQVRIRPDRAGKSRTPEERKRMRATARETRLQSQAKKTAQ